MKKGSCLIGNLELYSSIARVTGLAVAGHPGPPECHLGRCSSHQQRTSNSTCSYFDPIANLWALLKTYGLARVDCGRGMIMEALICAGLRHYIEGDSEYSRRPFRVNLEEPHGGSLSHPFLII
jgi:hypothetical protein